MNLEELSRIWNTKNKKEKGAYANYTERVFDLARMRDENHLDDDEIFMEGDRDA